MAQIKIINFEFCRDEKLSVKEMCQLHIDFEFIVSKAELFEPNNYAVQFSINGGNDDKQKFKLLGCELPLAVSINDYKSDIASKRLIDEKGRLHYLLHQMCEIKLTNEFSNIKNSGGLDAVFIMADLYTSEKHLLIGFTGSASKKLLGVTVLK